MSIIYFILLFALAIGILATGMKSPINKYIVTNNNLTPWAIGLIMFAGIGPSFLIDISSWSAKVGYDALSMVIGIGLGFYFMAYVLKKLLPLFKEKGYMNFHDLLYDQYGGTVTNWFTIFTIISAGAFLLVQLLYAATILNGIYPLTYEVYVLIICLLLFVYGERGGFGALARIDTRLSILLLAAFIYYLYHIDFSAIPLASIKVGESGIITPALFAVIGFVGSIGSATMWQKLLSSKDTRSVMQGTLLGIGLYALFGIIVLLIIAHATSEVVFIDASNAFINVFVGMGKFGPIVTYFLIFAYALTSVHIGVYMISTVVHNQLICVKRLSTITNYRSGYIATIGACFILAILFPHAIDIFRFISLLVVPIGILLFLAFTTNLSKKAMVTGQIFGTIGFIVTLVLNAMKLGSPIMLLLTLIGVGIGAMVFRKNKVHRLIGLKLQQPVQK